jgi:hypothetical protein
LATELGLRCNTLSPWGFGVQIEGFDTSRPAAPASAALLRSLLAKHKLLLIRGGRLDAPQLADLGRSLELGEAETFGAADYVDVDYMSTFPDEPNVMQIEYGPHSAPADINIWHMDHSWHVAPTRYELSYADVSPATGGDVIFADTCAAYETLSPLMQDMLSGATCLNILANGYQYDTNRSHPKPSPPSPFRLLLTALLCVSIHTYSCIIDLLLPHIRPVGLSFPTPFFSCLVSSCCRSERKDIACVDMAWQEPGNGVGRVRAGNTPTNAGCCATSSL